MVLQGTETLDYKSSGPRQAYQPSSSATALSVAVSLALMRRVSAVLKQMALTNLRSSPMLALPSEMASAGYPQPS